MVIAVSDRSKAKVNPCIKVFDYQTWVSKL